MARMSVSEAADALGVNVQRVHQRIADGSLPAERVGHQWVIDDADLDRLDRRGAGRLLSPRSAWALVIVAAEYQQSMLPLDGASAGHSGAGNSAPPSASRPISPSERSRARARLRGLLNASRIVGGNLDAEVAANRVAAQLRSLLRNRADRKALRGQVRDLDDLRSDTRLKPSGVSQPQSGIASGAFVEGYVTGFHLEDLVSEYLLSESRHGDANVVLHAYNPADIPGWNFDPANWLLLASDLAEHHRPREVSRAVQILKQVADASVTSRRSASGD